MVTHTSPYTPALAWTINPEAYFWRLTNGKAPKTFHEGAHNTKWWLLELIPIEVKKET